MYSLIALGRTSKLMGLVSCLLKCVISMLSRSKYVAPGAVGARLPIPQDYFDYGLLLQLQLLGQRDRVPTHQEL